MLFFGKKKKKKEKSSIGGFFRNKLFGDTDFSEAGTILKQKISEGVKNVASSREKLKDLPGTNYELGIHHMQAGNFFDAIFRFKMVCRFAPDNIDAYYNLGRCYMFRGENEEAKKTLEHVLEKDSKHFEAKYLLKKIDAPEKLDSIPESIIKETVDIRAGFYEQDFIENGYMGSKSLVNMAFKDIDAKNPNYDVLDLGCGTGACGHVLKKRFLARTVTGVDLSGEMLKLCSKLAIENERVYDNLHEAEISRYLKSEKSKYDMILSDLAMDFIGKLDDYVLSVKNALKEGGWYATVVRFEDDLEKGYKLNLEFEDFSYSRKYFVDSFQKAGFKLSSSKEIDMVGDEKVEMLIFKS